MKCLNPTFVGWLRDRRPDGVFNVIRPSQGPRYMLSRDDPSALWVPCGKCPLCLKRKKRDMTVRLVHESLCYERSSFVTLTYNDENLPRPFGPDDDFAVLVKKDVQDWLKRLRYFTGSKFRYFAVGEHGARYGRPHYHVIIFGWWPHDAYIHEWRNKYAVYRSPLLEKSWPFGFSTVGEVNPAVAKYCARYVLKKMDSESGDEFWLQSKRQGGVGAPYFDRYWSDFARTNSAYVKIGDRVITYPVPKYYLARMRKYHLDEYIDLMDRRARESHPSDAFADLVSAADAFIYKETQSNKKRRLDNEEDNACCL